ncbi:hypothetical protein EON65_49645 [archaeon]|nr:MAG: hypothetical protein EON65_49645 [archaeon]
MINKSNTSLLTISPPSSISFSSSSGSKLVHYPFNCNCIILIHNTEEKDELILHPTSTHYHLNKLFIHATNIHLDCRLSEAK